MREIEIWSLNRRKLPEESDGFNFPSPLVVVRSFSNHWLGGIGWQKRSWFGGPAEEAADPHTMEHEMRKKEEEKSICCSGEIGETKGRELLRETWGRGNDLGFLVQVIWISYFFRFPLFCFISMMKPPYVCLIGLWGWVLTIKSEDGLRMTDSSKWTTHTQPSYRRTESLELTLILNN